MKKVLSLFCVLAFALLITEGAYAVTSTAKSNAQLAQFVGVETPTTPAAWTSLINTYASYKAQLEAAAVATNTAPKAKVLSPNGGETLINGQSYTIKWDAVADKIDIRLSGPSGTADIKNGLPNTGSYTWTVNAKDGVNKPYQIGIRANKTNIGSTYDVSDAVFKIVSASTTTASTTPFVTLTTTETAVPGGYEVGTGTGLFAIDLKVKAMGGDVFLSPTGMLKKDVFYVESGNGNKVALENMSYSFGPKGILRPTAKGYYKIPKGEEIEFSLFVAVYDVPSGLYRMTMKSLPWSATEVIPTEIYTFPQGLRTEFFSITNSVAKRNGLQASVQRAIQNILFMFGK